MSRDVHCCTHWLRSRNFPPPPSPRIYVLRGRNWSAKIDHRRHLFVIVTPWCKTFWRFCSVLIFFSDRSSMTKRCTLPWWRAGWTTSWPSTSLTSSSGRRTSSLKNWFLSFSQQPMIRKKFISLKSLAGRKKAPHWRTVVVETNSFPI